MEDTSNWQTGNLQKGEHRFREEFARIKEYCQAQGIALDLVIVPSRQEVERIQAAAPNQTNYVSESRRRAIEIFDALQLPYIDLTESLAREPIDSIYFVFDGHLTARGHEVAYSELTRRIGTEL